MVIIYFDVSNIKITTHIYLFTFFFAFSSIFLCPVTIKYSSNIFTCIRIDRFHRCSLWWPSIFESYSCRNECNVYRYVIWWRFPFVFFSSFLRRNSNNIKFIRDKMIIETRERSSINTFLKYSCCMGTDFPRNTKDLNQLKCSISLSTWINPKRTAIEWEAKNV